MEFIYRDILEEKLKKDSKACLNIANQISNNKIKRKLYFDEEIKETHDESIKRKYTEMFDEFDNADQLEGARKFLNKLLINKD
ncbi:MAG: hypothetical protein ACRC7N_13700 [Clostridium sp.]